MANRDFDPNVPTTNVVPEHAESNFLLGLAEVGAKAAEAGQQSKLLANGAQAHTQFKALDAQYRMKFADNPGSPEAQDWLKEQRQAVTDGLGSDISPLYQRQWQTKLTELGAASDISNEAWSVHQNYHNAVNNTNTAMKSYLDMGNKDGLAYGMSPSTDGGNIMNFLQARQSLMDGASPYIGADKTGALLKDFEKDYAKSFVAGVAESNPEKATEMLDMPEVKQHFTTQDRIDMVQVIERTKKAQQLARSMSVTTNDAELVDIANNPNMTYYEKRAAIDQGELERRYSAGGSSRARRVIKSSDDLDTQTDTPVMANIVSKIYDLNANAATSGDDYLRGIRNIQETILDKQADGSLTARDAMKLQNQVRTLTSAKMASATQAVGLEFYEANQKFDQLPPEFRGDATRQLFYAADGKNYTPQQYQASAMGIIDSINRKRRAATQETLKAAAAGDNEFLKSMNATMADVNETARLHHITPEEVLRHLRANHLEKMNQKRMGKARNISPDDQSGDLGEPAAAAQPNMTEPIGIDEEGPTAGEGE